MNDEYEYEDGQDEYEEWLEAGDYEYHKELDEE